MECSAVDVRLECVSEESILSATMKKTKRESFGDRLKRVCGDMGVSQHELARRAGMPQPNISLYFNGKQIPDLARIARLAAAIDIPPEELVRDISELHVKNKRK